MNSDLVSIVLPVFNCSSFISSAISSLIRQTYQNIEIIIINDGSTDGTSDICQAFAELDSRIRIYNQPNRGISASLNLGISLAKGYWIARMDADDISMPHRIEAQLIFARANGIDILGSNIFLFSGNINLGLRKYPVTNSQIRSQALFNSPLCHPSIFIKSIIIKQYLYNSDYNGIEDYELWLRMMRDKNIVFSNFNQPLLKYRKSKSQITAKRRVVNISIRRELSISYANECFQNQELLSFVELYFSLIGSSANSSSCLYYKQLLSSYTIKMPIFPVSVDKNILYANLFRACLLSCLNFGTLKIFSKRYAFGVRHTLALICFSKLPILIRRYLIKFLLFLS